MNFNLLNVSCHHGAANDENNLASCQQILDKYNEIDVIEIDFIYYEGEFVSSHDYDNVKGDKLEIWIDEIIKRNKVLCIDLKDSQLSFFINVLSKINIQHLYDKLNELHLK